jgi:hypothetical protein
VPFERLGLRSDLGQLSYPSHSKAAMELVPPAVVAVGGVLAGAYLINRRREVARREGKEQKE